MKLSILGALYFFSAFAFAQADVVTVRACSAPGIRVVQQFISGMESILVKEDGAQADRYFACRRFDDADELTIECQGTGETEDITLTVYKAENTASLNGTSLICE